MWWQGPHPVAPLGGIRSVLLAALAFGEQGRDGLGVAGGAEALSLQKGPHHR